MRIETEKRKVFQRPRDPSCPRFGGDSFALEPKNGKRQRGGQKAGGIFLEIHGFFGDGLFGFEYRKHRKKLVSFDHKH